MRFESVATLPAPRARVFAIYRDEMQALQRYLPNIRSITTTARRTDGAITEMSSDWAASAEIPAVARRFVDGDATGWTDHATWDESRWTCAWRTVPHAFREAVTSHGGHVFEAINDAETRVTISGVVEVDVSKIAGVPRLLAGTLRPVVESFVVGGVRDNLDAFAKAVARYLAEHPAR